MVVSTSPDTFEVFVCACALSMKTVVAGMLSQPQPEAGGQTFCLLAFQRGQQARGQPG